MIPTSYYLALSLAALLAFGLVWWIWRGEKRREPVRVVSPSLDVSKVHVATAWRREKW